MFFDQTINFRIRKEEHDKAMAFVLADPEIENISHLSRIALLQFIHKPAKKPVIKEKTEFDLKELAENRSHTYSCGCRFYNYSEHGVQQVIACCDDHDQM